MKINYWENLPMIMYPQGDDGGDGGGGGDAGAGDQGDGAGDAGDGDAGAGDDNNTGDGDAGDDAGKSDEDGDKSGDAGDAGDDAGSGDKGPNKAGAKITKDSGDNAGAEKAKGVWSEEWREEYAGDNEKVLNYLNRFTGPKGLIDKLMEQDKLIRSGGHKTEKPGDEATDDEKAAYRKELGVPDTPDGYLEALPEGMVLGDAEKESAGEYLKAMHDLNAPPEYAAAGLEAFTKHVENHTNSIMALDQEAADNAAQELREEWGNDYQPNVTAMENFITRNFPSDVQEFLMNGRLGDENGTPLLADTRVIKAFAQIERELNPRGSVVSAKGIDNVDGINDQIKIYEGRMKTDRTAWFKDEPAQKHLQELYRAKERYKQRS